MFSTAKVEENPYPFGPAMSARLLLQHPVTALPLDEQVRAIVAWAKQGQSRVVCVANVHMLMEATWDPAFANVLKRADLVTPDGMPLVWMLRLLGVRGQERVAGMDLLETLCLQAPLAGISLYFVGSTPETLARMRQRLEIEYGNVRIAGMESLPFRSLTAAEDAALLERIHRSGAGVVLVSLGCPKQEKWMAQHQGRIQAVMVGLGGVFPVYAGEKQRAPRLVREWGLEWAYRLVQEPTRLWKRYGTTIPPFIWLAVRQLLAHYSQQLGAKHRNRVGQLMLGQILIERGLITRIQLEETLILQYRYQKRLGELLLERQLIEPEHLDWALMRQAGLKSQPLAMF